MELQLELQDVKGKLEDLLESVNRIIIAEIPKNIKGEIVIANVLEYAGMTMEQMTESQVKGLIFYKRIMTYILHDYCNWTYNKIAGTINIKSHATIKHHVNKMQWWMANPRYGPADVLIATRAILNSLGYEKE